MYFLQKSPVYFSIFQQNINHFSQFRMFFLIVLFHFLPNSCGNPPLSVLSRRYALSRGKVVDFRPGFLWKSPIVPAGGLCYNPTQCVSAAPAQFPLRQGGLQWRFEKWLYRNLYLFLSISWRQMFFRRFPAWRSSVPPGKTLSFGPNIRMLPSP